MSSSPLPSKRNNNCNDVDSTSTSLNKAESVVIENGRLNQATSAVMSIQSHLTRYSALSPLTKTEPNEQEEESKKLEKANLQPTQLQSGLEPPEVVGGADRSENGESCAATMTLDMSDCVVEPKKRFYLILHDVSKKNNCGTLLRSASAFGCSGVIVQARRRADITTFGAHGADKHLQLFFVPSNTPSGNGDLFAFARTELGCRIVGVEIRDDAMDVTSARFSNLVENHASIAFVLGNEGSGLHPSVAAKCDDFVYIPHFGGGTASLNVAVAGSIVFHRFAERAAYTERAREGEKYVVDKLTKEQRQQLNEEEAKMKRQSRAAARKQQDGSEEDDRLGLVAADELVDESDDDGGRTE